MPRERPDWTHDMDCPQSHTPRARSRGDGKLGSSYRESWSRMPAAWRRDRREYVPWPIPWHASPRSTRVQTADAGQSSHHCHFSVQCAYPSLGLGLVVSRRSIMTRYEAGYVTFFGLQPTRWVVARGEADISHPSKALCYPICRDGAVGLGNLFVSS